MKIYNTVEDYLIDFFSKNTDDVITGTFYYEDIAKILNKLLIL